MRLRFGHLPWHVLPYREAMRRSHTCVSLCAAGELWEKSGFAKGRPGDSYTWGRADVSCGHGRIVQVSAGAPSKVSSIQLCCICTFNTSRTEAGLPMPSAAVTPCAQSLLPLSTPSLAPVGYCWHLCAPYPTAHTPLCSAVH